MTALMSVQPNILLDKQGCARITDFGLTTVTQNLDSIRSVSDDHGHTGRWAAPEILNGGEFSKEADVFSFAMVMIEVRQNLVVLIELKLIVISDCHRHSLAPSHSTERYPPRLCC